MNPEELARILHLEDPDARVDPAELRALLHRRPDVAARHPEVVSLMDLEEQLRGEGPPPLRLPDRRRGLRARSLAAAAALAAVALLVLSRELPREAPPDTTRSGPRKARTAPSMSFKVKVRRGGVVRSVLRIRRHRHRTAGFHFEAP